MLTKKKLIGLTITLSLTSYSSFANSEQVHTINFKVSQAQLENGITNVPKELGKEYSLELGFNRYTSVITPSGKPIHIVAQDQLRDSQIIRARSVLEHYLTNYEYSKYGMDKRSIANRMAKNKATLLLLNGIDDGSNLAQNLNGQPLYEEEIQVEGDSWYMSQNYDHRDATFEEILHLVHDYGIGVDGNSEFIGELPAYQHDIRHAQKNALTNKIWAMDSSSEDWIDELNKENSLSQEYLAAVIDTYYGLWGAYSDLLNISQGEDTNGLGMWGLYIAATRDELQLLDPLGYQVAIDFFHPYLTYNAQLDHSLSGTFSLKYDKSIPYTNHSRYLKNITITGENSVNIVVNELDNQITGNVGHNTVLFTGMAKEYSINNIGDKTLVEDSVAGRDGKNELIYIEALQFSDVKIYVSDILINSPNI